MNNQLPIAEAGNLGDRVRSDCYVRMQLTENGGRVIRQTSKVNVLYGKANYTLIDDFLNFYNIEHIEIELIDKGALPLVLMARLEAAWKKLTNSTREFLPEILPESETTTSRDRYRFSRLYLPGNTASMMLNAGVHKPNGIILDLEDSVAPSKKEEARFLIRNVLRGIRFYGAERMVRINQLPAGLIDLEFVVGHGAQLVLLPKCESAEQVQQVAQKMNELEKEGAQQVLLMPIIESAMGVEQAFAIAKASERVVALAIGLEDLTADLGVSRTQKATESLYARTRVVNACKAAQIQAIDSVFSDVGDEVGLRQTIAESRSIGFEGMGCIHPRQIKVIHECYAPTTTEIEKAIRIVDAFEKAEVAGKGVVALGSKMIDPPVVKRALRTVSLASSLGLLTTNNK